MKQQRAQIIATIGPVSASKEVLSAMIGNHMDAARLNFSWSDPSEHEDKIALIKEVARAAGKRIPIIMDLPGPRVQEAKSHAYDSSAPAGLTDKDKELIKFGVEHGVDYIAVSFVGGPKEVEDARAIVHEAKGDQRIIAKIERAVAVEKIDEIIKTADAVMVARGDLGSDVPLEQIPFIQEKIIRACKAAKKPVIVATQILLSMKDNPTPTRAEVTDEAVAILEGADAVMLSEETAIGKYPAETVAMMEKILIEAEKHMDKKAAALNPL